MGKKTADTKSKGVTAFLVAEAVGLKTEFKIADIPVALAPIANRPAIDYAIENIIRNGIRKIVVLASASDGPKIRHHIHSTWAYYTKSSASKTTKSSTSASSSVSVAESPSSMKGHKTNRDAEADLREGNNADSIEVRECPLGNGCYDVLMFIKEKNLAPEGEHFVIIPMDSISNISNLQQLIAKAIARHTEHHPVLTAVVRQDDKSLRSIYASVMQDEMEKVRLEEEEETRKNEHSAAGLRTPAVLKSQWGKNDLFDIEDDESHQSEKALVPRCTIVFDPTSGVVHGFKEWRQLSDDELSNLREGNEGSGDCDGDDEGPEAPYKPMESFTIKKNMRICVRTDLMLTGILICSTDVFQSPLNKYQTSTVAFVNEYIARAIEWGDINIAIDVADASAVVCPLVSLPALLSANQRVSARYLHPMTRESNFGEYVNSKYYVSLSNPLVCVPHEGCPDVRGTIEGTGVFGRRTALHPSSYMANSSLGDYSKVGKNVTIVNSIIGKNVTIADGATIANSFILDGSIVREGHVVRNTIFGVRDLTSRTDAAKNKVRFTDTILTDSDPTRSFDRVDLGIIPTYEMLTSDNLSGAAAEATDNESPDSQFKRLLWESYLNNPDADSTLEVGLKELRISAHKTNIELAQAMFEVTLTNIADEALKDHIKEREERRKRKAEKAKNRGDDDDDDDEDEEDEEDSDENEDDFVASWDYVKPLFSEKVKLWNKTVLWDFISLSEEKEVFSILRGVSLALAKRKCLQPLGNKILGLLYCFLDEETFEQRSFCVVPPHTIISFLKQQEKAVEDKNDNDDDDDDESDSNSASTGNSESDDGSDSDEDEEEEDEEELVAYGWRFLSKYANNVREAFEEEEEEEDDDDDDNDDDESEDESD